jgi:hypothetical protein
MAGEEVAGSQVRLSGGERITPLEVRYSGAALALVHGLLGAGPCRSIAETTCAERLGFPASGVLCLTRRE